MVYGCLEPARKRRQIRRAARLTRRRVDRPAPAARSIRRVPDVASLLLGPGRRRRWRIGETEHRRTAARRSDHLVGRFDLEVVIDVADTADPLDDVLGEPLLVPRSNAAVQRDLAPLDVHVDVARADSPI